MIWELEEVGSSDHLMMEPRGSDASNRLGWSQGGPMLAIVWVAVKELNLTYYIGKPYYCIHIYKQTHGGGVIQVP